MGGVSSSRCGGLLYWKDWYTCRCKNALCSLLHLHYKWDIRQLDVESAFLHGDLLKELYMAQPQGYADPILPNHVYHMHKSIYGLKQAPRAWFMKLRTHLLDIGFTSSNTDTSLFIHHAHGHITYLLLYVDIILTGNNTSYIRSSIMQLKLQLQ